MIMKCGHEYHDYELAKDQGIVFIQYTCVEGCKSEWGSVGEAPYPDELSVEDPK